MKNIFFDLYGTLIDIQTDENHLFFWEKLTKKWKKYHDYTPTEFKNQYLSICLMLEKTKEEIDLLDAFAELLNVDKDLAEKFARDFRQYSTKYLRLYPGVKDLLKKLKKKGYGLYVLSNAQTSFTIPELKKLKIFHYFNDIAISSEYGVKKPNPEFFLQAIKKFNLSISTLIMIGNDYECDILSARKLGIKSIFIQSNLTPQHDSKDYELGFNSERLLKKIEEL